MDIFDYQDQRSYSGEEYESFFRILKDGDRDKAAQMLDRHPDLLWAKTFSRGWMGLAAGYKHAGMIRLLAERGLPVDEVEGSGFFPLWQAIEKDSADCVATLLELGADPNQKRGDRTLLHLATCSSSLSTTIVEMLLRYGADPNVVDNQGRTPLWTEASYGFAEAVRLLMSYGADPGLHGPAEPLSAIEHARFSGFLELADEMQGVKQARAAHQMVEQVAAVTRDLGVQPLGYLRP